MCRSGLRRLGLFGLNLLRLRFLRLSPLWLDEDRRYWPGLGALGDQRAVLPVKLDAGGFDDVGILPEARTSGVSGDCRMAAGGHAPRRDVDWRRGSQQRAVGLFLQFTVSALDVAFGEGFSRGAVDADGVRGGRHSAFDHPGITGRWTG